VIRRAIHSAVELAVTESEINRRRWCLRMTKTKSNRKPTVGTIRKSIAPMPAAWLCRKVFQVYDHPRPLLAMRLATVDCAISIPSFSSSPWIRGAPHSRLARLISRIRRPTSGVFASILGLALQSILADVFSGIALNLSKVYDVGDWIVRSDGTEGRVIEKNWRTTHLLNASNDLAGLPNGSLAKAQLKTLSTVPTENVIRASMRSEIG
jgi:Mechanosensitive ion channel